MINNISLKEIGKMLQDAESILLFPHENADGDALGSCVALCTTLRNEGKRASVYVGEKPADYISFIAGDCCVTEISVRRILTSAFAWTAARKAEFPAD